jgi:hypothetical protein
MGLSINDTAPGFEAGTTQGKITTELGCMAKLAPGQS